MADLMEQYANVSSSGAETTYVNAPNNELEIVSIQITIKSVLDLISRILFIFHQK